MYVTFVHILLAKTSHTIKANLNSMLYYRGNAQKSHRCEDREMAQHGEVLANLTTEPGTHVKSEMQKHTYNLPALLQRETGGENGENNPKLSG